jgi:hypothetical protein
VKIWVLHSKAFLFVCLFLLSLIGGCQCQQQAKTQPSPFMPSTTPIASATLESTSTQIMMPIATTTPIITPVVTPAPAPALTPIPTPIAPATPGSTSTQILMPTATPTPVITSVVTPAHGPNPASAPATEPTQSSEEFTKLVELRDATKSLMEEMSPPISGSRVDPGSTPWSVFPEGFYGTVTINGHPAPVSTKIEARGDNVVTHSGNPQTTTESGFYSCLIVAGDIYSGTTIRFYINGIAATQTTTFRAASIRQLNLTVGD